MAGATKNEKTFDCIEYKRRVQAEIYEEIKGMSHEEEIAYFQGRAENGALADLWNRVKAHAPTPTGQ